MNAHGDARMSDWKSLGKQGMGLSTWKFLLLACLAAGVSAEMVGAADLLRVLPVTRNIVVFHFKDGHIDYNGFDMETGKWEGQTNNRVYHRGLLNFEAATSPASYRITSADDADFQAGLQPVHVGHKSKGADFNAPWKEPQFLREHWVYAELPQPLKQNRTYTVRVGEVAKNLNEYTFTFDPNRVQSPTIRISQVGFPVSAPKCAYFSQWMGTFNSPQHRNGGLDLSDYRDGRFHIVDAATGEVRRTYEGLQLQKPKTEPDNAAGNWSQADVYSLDFSGFREPGRYVLVAENMGRSFPFEINDSVYWSPFRDTMRAVFLQRKGIYKWIDEHDMLYPRSCHPDLVDFEYGHVHGEGAKIDDPRPVTGIWGWYADAGDWDGYPTHWNVPATMLLLYDLKPENFRDGDISNRWKEKTNDKWIDEGQSGLPDLLDEARWLLDFYRRARAELVRQGLGTGGVPGYVGRDAGATNHPSWADTRGQYISLENLQTTYAYAGLSAHYAHNINKFYRLSGNDGPHPDAAEWIQEAREAFQWAEDNRDALISHPRHNADRVGQMRMVAGVGLYLVTDEPAFQTVFKEEWQKDGQTREGSWVSPNANMVAAGIYLVSCKEKPNLDSAHYDAVRHSIIQRANLITDKVEQFGFRWAGVEPHQAYLMNGISVPRTFFHVLAYETTGEQKYLDAMHLALAYVFGGNQEGRTRVSGTGFDREQDPFHCDSWFLFDLNHMAYRNPSLMGHSTYALIGFDVGGPGSEAWARSSAIPAIPNPGSTDFRRNTIWPIGEQRMRNRYSISGSEFTIHQNPPWYIMALGYLVDPEAPRPGFSRPTVELQLPEGRIQIGQVVSLRAKASSDTERVEYWYNSYFAGESTNATDGFAVQWNTADAGVAELGSDVLITAIAYDLHGEPTIPTPGGEKKVQVDVAFMATDPARASENNERIQP